MRLPFSYLKKKWSLNNLQLVCIDSLEIVCSKVLSDNSWTYCWKLVQNLTEYFLQHVSHKFLFLHFIRTRRYGPLRLVTVVTFSSNLSNLKKNTKRSKKNRKKSEKKKNIRKYKKNPKNLQKKTKNLRIVKNGQKI